MRNRYSSRRADEVFTAEDLIAEAEDYELKEVFLERYTALKQKYNALKAETGYLIKTQGHHIKYLQKQYDDLKAKPPRPDAPSFLEDEYRTLQEMYHEERRKNIDPQGTINELKMHNKNLQNQLDKYRSYYQTHIQKYNETNKPGVKVHSSKPKGKANKKKMTIGNRSYNNKSKKKSRVKKRR